MNIVGIIYSSTKKRFSVVLGSLVTCGKFFLCWLFFFFLKQMLQPFWEVVAQYVLAFKDKLLKVDCMGG